MCYNWQDILDPFPDDYFDVNPDGTINPDTSAELEIMDIIDIELPLDLEFDFENDGIFDFNDENSPSPTSGDEDLISDFYSELHYA
jgi:hypothetical protein